MQICNPVTMAKRLVIIIFFIIMPWIFRTCMLLINSLLFIFWASLYQCIFHLVRIREWFTYFHFFEKRMFKRNNINNPQIFKRKLANTIWKIKGFCQDEQVYTNKVDYKNNFKFIFHLNVFVLIHLFSFIWHLILIY